MREATEQYVKSSAHAPRTGPAAGTTTTAGGGEDDVTALEEPSALEEAAADVASGSSG
jgi:hypothetical protein